MMMRSSLRSFIALLAASAVIVGLATSNKKNNEALRRLLVVDDESSSSEVENAHEQTLRSRSRSLKEWKLPHWSTQWCDAPDLPPLVFDYCDPADGINLIRYEGGWHHGLTFILLGALESMEQKKCFVIDEQPTNGGEQICTTIDGQHECIKKTTAANSELQRYFEPMGLPFDHPYVTQAFANNKVQIWTAPTTHLKYRLLGYQFNIPLVIGYSDKVVSFVLAAVLLFKQNHVFLSSFYNMCDHTHSNQPTLQCSFIHSLTLHRTAIS